MLFHLDIVHFLVVGLLATQLVLRLLGCAHSGSHNSSLLVNFWIEILVHLQVLIWVGHGSHPLLNPRLRSYKVGCTLAHLGLRQSLEKRRLKIHRTDISVVVRISHRVVLLDKLLKVRSHIYSTSGLVLFPTFRLRAIAEDVGLLELARGDHS